ncbi:MAG: hypothetical protein M1816_000672 [Peltula sp. TS41687]|nr:MAG: hypothetical protein M1816_000672 [Peltula sp. TS41687]
MSTITYDKNDVDFQALAREYPDFAKFLKSNGQLDFSDPEAVQELTRSLLKRDFGIAIDLPGDRLCPPVPNRYNYIRWLQNLLDTSSDGYTEDYDPERDVTSLDMALTLMHLYSVKVGREQVAYTLYLDALNDQDGDIDAKNLNYAQQNVALNNLKARIKIIKSTAQSLLIPIDALGLDSIDFTMCNPPFYESTDEMLSSAKQKQRPPFSACTGAEIEMVTPGGEVAFVKRMINDSTVLKQRVQWYTSMLGKLSSVSTIIGLLNEAGIQNWAVTEFIQGSKTRRWAIAWSWGDLRPRMDVARGVATLPKHLLPFPSEFSFTVEPASIDRLGRRLDETIRSLQAAWQWNAAITTGVGFVMGNVWSRSFRRKNKKAIKKEQGTDKGEKEVEDEEDALLGFKIQLRYDKGSREIVCVLVKWLKGNDSVLFESFCGMLKRTLEMRDE